jgi:hypothetical protein
MSKEARIVHSPLPARLFLNLESNDNTLEPDSEMFADRLRMGILLLFCLATAAPARADGPDANFQLLADETVTSPDRQVRVEQYSADQADEGFLHQFWTFDSDHQHGSLLNPGETTEVAGYPAGFRFSPDSQWLVRMQKLGAGYQTLFLYRCDGARFSSATVKPLGDLAWDYFFSLPASMRLHRDPGDRESLDHQQVNLLKGLDENYAWLGSIGPTAAVSRSPSPSTPSAKTNPFRGSKAGAADMT